MPVTQQVIELRISRQYEWIRELEDILANHDPIEYGFTGPDEVAHMIELNYRWISDDEETLDTLVYG